MLYPPCMVPRISTAFRLDTKGEVAVPSSTAVSQLALTYAASSTPGGTRFSNRSISAASSPLGGFSSCSTSEATCFASKGLGAMFSAARSATCASYSVRNVDAAREESAAQGGRSEEGFSARAPSPPRAAASAARRADEATGAIKVATPLDAPETPTLAQGRASRRRTARPLRSIVAAVGLGRDTTGEEKRDGQSRVLDARSAAAPRGRTPPELWGKMDKSVHRDVEKYQAIDREPARARRFSRGARAHLACLQTGDEPFGRDGRAVAACASSSAGGGEKARTRCAFCLIRFRGGSFRRFEIFWATLRHVRLFARPFENRARAPGDSGIRGPSPRQPPTSDR